MSGPRRELPYVTIAAVVPCPAGWLSVSARIVGVTVVVEEPRSYATFVEVLDHRPRFATIALASPVGLPDEPTGGYRRADEAARAHLPWKLRVTVPRVPCKEALYAPSLEAAQVIEPWVTLAEYRRFFQWREVDSELQPFHQRTVFSGLPELSYGLLAGEGGLKTTPNTPEGQRERIDLIDKRIPGVRTAVEDCDLRGVDIRHLVDAAGLLWTARRIQGRVLTRFPQDPQWNEDGLRIEVVC